MNDSKTKVGMRYPSIDQLVSKTTSKYKLVIAVAKRAREIEETSKVYLENTSNKKAIGIALEEVQADKIIIKD
jgi:DNA-directed RNA polymerase subunit omega